MLCVGDADRDEMDVGRQGTVRRAGPRRATASMDHAQTRRVRKTSGGALKSSMAVGDAQLCLFISHALSYKMSRSSTTALSPSKKSHFCSALTRSYSHGQSMFIHAFGSLGAVPAHDAHIRCVSRSLDSPLRK